MVRSDITINHDWVSLTHGLLRLSNQPSRSYLAVASAIIIAGVLVSASLLVVFGGGKTTTVFVSPTSSASHTATQVYKVTFNQTGQCPPPRLYYAPWYVTLGSETQIEPPNATLPLSTLSGTAASYYQRYSTILFSVPDGTYEYTLQVVGSSPFVGTVAVNGSDVTISVLGQAVACVAIPSDQTSGNQTSRTTALASGLQLSISVNSSSVAPGGTVAISIGISNPSAKSINVSSANDWLPYTQHFLPPNLLCPTYTEPIGIGIFEGHVNAANLSLATPFELYVANGSRPIVTSCPAILPPPSAYVYGPGQGANVTYDLRGYWVVDTDATSYVPPVLHLLQPGAYTVAAETEWGDAVLVYFQVT
jgi:hypothetical protein